MATIRGTLRSRSSCRRFSPKRVAWAVSACSSVSRSVCGRRTGGPPRSPCAGPHQLERQTVQPAQLGDDGLARHRHGLAHRARIEVAPIRYRVDAELHPFGERGSADALDFALDQILSRKGRQVGMADGLHGRSTRPFERMDIERAGCGGSRTGRTTRQCSHLATPAQAYGYSLGSSRAWRDP